MVTKAGTVTGIPAATAVIDIGINPYLEVPRVG
jgi:hypothetical protein